MFWWTVNEMNRIVIFTRFWKWTLSAVLPKTITNRQQKVHFLDDTRVMLFITDWLFAVFWLTWDIDRFDSKTIINWRRTKQIILPFSITSNIFKKRNFAFSKMWGQRCTKPTGKCWKNLHWSITRCLRSDSIRFKQGAWLWRIRKKYRRLSSRKHRQNKWMATLWWIALLFFLN